MLHLSIKIEKNILRKVDKVSKPLGLDREQVIHEALKTWLKKNESSLFEREWITALRKYPDETKRAEDWLDVQG